MSHNQSKEARETLKEASGLLAKAEAGSEGDAARLRLQYEVLRACLHAGEGNIEALTSSGEIWIINLRVYERLCSYWKH